MNKEDIKKLAKNKNFIPGIYNYCDRWCERCPLTSRCMNFAMTRENSDDPEASDITNEKFWQSLSEIFKVTREMLEESPKDSDGSAKVALIAIDRSMAAWGQMHTYFPAHRNQILSVIKHLDSLRKRAENVFPEARNFICPGVDQ